MKRFLKSSAAVLIAFTLSSSAFAATDLEGHWAKNTINEMINNGYISGYSDGTIKPDNLIKRAEFMSAVNKIFGYSQKSNINFSDVKKSDWFYDTVRIAVNAGYISGYSDNTIKAENYITKQEAVFIINKIMKYSPDSAYADKFTDGGRIDKWVKGEVGALAKNGIITGYSDGSFKAKNNITRAEAFTILSRADKLKKGELDVSKTPSPEADSQYLGYTLPQEVSTFADWKKAINYSIYTLRDTLEIKIIGFNDSVYDLKKLGIITVGIKAEGSLKNGTASVKYSFDYGENFKMLRAVNDSSLSSKLNEKESRTIAFFEDVKNEIIRDDMTDYEKELAIHDYIILNYEYASDELDEKNENYYKVSSFADTKKGVCEAYAYSFAILAALSGLDCKMMYGIHDGVNHAWNAVKLDGEYYYVDTTFDDGVESNDIVIYKYFNLNDETLSKTHTWNKEQNDDIQTNAVKYNYFNYNDLIFSDKASLEKFLSSQIINNEEIIHFYAQNLNLTQSDISDILFKSSSQISGYRLAGDLEKDGAFALILEYR